MMTKTESSALTNKCDCGKDAAIFVNNKWKCIDCFNKYLSNIRNFADKWTAAWAKESNT